MANKKCINGDAHIRATIHIVWQHLGSVGDGSVNVGGTYSTDQIAYQRLQLVFRLGIDLLSEVVHNRSGKFVDSLGEEIR